MRKSVNTDQVGSTRQTPHFKSLGKKIITEFRMRHHGGMRQTVTKVGAFFLTGAYRVHPRPIGATRPPISRHHPWVEQTLSCFGRAENNLLFATDIDAISTGTCFAEPIVKVDASHLFQQNKIGTNKKTQLKCFYVDKKITKKSKLSVDLSRICFCQINLSPKQSRVSLNAPPWRSCRYRRHQDYMQMCSFDECEPSGASCPILGQKMDQVK